MEPIYPLVSLLVLFWLGNTFFRVRYKKVEKQNTQAIPRRLPFRSFMKEMTIKSNDYRKKKFEFR